MSVLFHVKGKMSTFGGPDDKWMEPKEGLAIFYTEASMREHGLGDFLLPEEDYPDFGLARRLNPEKFYLACRWDYGTTSIPFLRDAWAWVENPANGKKFEARPMDWGPHEDTGRVADLSPGLARALGLKTDQECVITIGEAQPKDFPQKLVDIAREQYDRYHNYKEGDPELTQQIKRFWEDLGLEFPGVGQTWSGVFVSWCVKQAGASGQEFLFHKKHSEFVYQAIENKKNQMGVFRGYKINDFAPKLGDIIQNNLTGKNYTYDYAATNRDYGSYSAIVVEKGTDARGPFVKTIGGNMQDSIGKQRITLQDNGRIKQRGETPFICVIQTLKK